MTCLSCWDIDCAVDGVIQVWSDAEPTLCPNDGNHALNGVTATSQPMACSEIFMHDGAARVYKMTIDQNGAWQSTQVSGPAPS